MSTLHSETNFESDARFRYNCDVIFRPSSVPQQRYVQTLITLINLLNRRHNKVFAYIFHECDSISLLYLLFEDCFHMHTIHKQLDEST